MTIAGATFWLSMFFMLLLSSAKTNKELLVGGKRDAWKIPSSPSDTLNVWAASCRFQIGDSIVWEYNPKEDSVVQVRRNDYANCNISSPIIVYNDGNTRVKLDRAGPYYFISGAKGHCQNGQKMIIVVMSPRGPPPAISPTSVIASASASASAASWYHGASLYKHYGLLILSLLI